MATVRRWWESLLSSGAYPGETDVQRGRRRIVVGYLFFGALVRLIFAALNFDGGETQIGVILLSFGLVSVVALVALRLEPGWFVGIVYVLLVFQVVEPLVETVAQGGLAASGMVIVRRLLSAIVVSFLLSHPQQKPNVWICALQSLSRRGKKREKEGR